MSVLITVAGLRGKKPLTKRNNVIKGSRQIEYVTLGKILASKGEGVIIFISTKVLNCVFVTMWEFI